MIVSHTNYYCPGDRPLSFLSHLVMLAGTRQHFGLPTLLMPKALTNRARWHYFYLWAFPILSLLGSRAFCFHQSTGILVRMPTYVEGAQSQLNEKSYKF